MNGQLYAISFASTDATGVAQDVWQITASTKSNIRVREVSLYKIGSAFSDTAQELLTLMIRRGSTTAASGGATSIPRNLDARSNATAEFTTLINSTTPGSSTGHILFSGSWNTNRPFVWRPPKNESPVCKLSERLQVRLGASAATIVIAGSMIVEELGKSPGSAVK